MGGGGGGGGTAECTVPYMFGYGFSMHGIWGKSNSTLTDSTTGATTGTTTDSTTDSTTTDSTTASTTDSSTSTSTVSTVSTTSTQAMARSAVDDGMIQNDDRIRNTTTTNNNNSNNNETRQQDDFLPPPSLSPSTSAPDNATTTTNDQDDSSDYRQRQYDYDLVGALLHDAAVSNECSATGRFIPTNRSTLPHSLLPNHTLTLLRQIYPAMLTLP